MSKHYVVVSTYPEAGSKNIGDQLITTSLIKALRCQKGDALTFSIVWREAPWDEVEDIFRSADFVFFACLAIRSRMHEKEYPYLENILDSGIPYAVVSAGTDLDVSDDINELFDGFSSKSLSLLRRMDKEAVFFSTRGYLTQSFCRKIGLVNARFSGDVAFFNSATYDLAFKPAREVRRILISDPHKPKLYINALRSLVSGMRRVFPEAELVLVQHGVSKDVEIFAKDHDIELFKAYEDRYNGLDVYSRADLHVGFRVHAHVSALSQRIYSYLVEQDGRGCDYGLTLDRKISVSGYSHVRYRFDFSSIVGWGLGRFAKRRAVSLLAPTLLVSMIENDKEEDFSKFVGLERQLRGFADALTSCFQRIP